MSLRWSLVVLALLCLALPFAPVDLKAEEGAVQCHHLETGTNTADAICIGEDDYFADVCRAIAVYADRHDLPADFFARLIWQESRFNPMAVSRAGAQGIAQFMPGTARLRGLQQAFHPAQALAYSAEYLAFLNDRFGNLGLAAAAYNSGEGRVSRWRANGGVLPAETRHYVATITGAPVEAWLGGTIDDVDYTLQPDLPFQTACEQMAEGRSVPMLASLGSGWAPWGVLIAQNWSPAAATASFERIRAQHASVFSGETMLLLSGINPRFGPAPRYSAMIGRESREQAETLCARLRSAGGPCTVVKN